MDTTIGGELTRLLEASFTRKIPASVRVRTAFLVTKLGTAATAALLGVSRTSVYRYIAGTRTTPPATIADRLEREVRARWQPQLQARAARALGAGLNLETRARFGYDSGSGTSDDARIRIISQHLPSDYAQPLVDTHLAGGGEDALRGILADALGDLYFRDGGQRAHGLNVEFTDMEYCVLEP